MLASLSGCEKVVVLDTGSEDKTKEVATKFPNVEFHEGYVWKDDFAHARNHVKDLVPDGYDWILSIDCDEVLQCDWSTVQEAVDAIDPTGIDGISVKLIAAGTDGKSTVPAVRLFNRKASWK